MGRIIGIDLGTTNSVVAVADGSSAKVLENREARTQTRSVVGFKKKKGAPDGAGEILVGDAAMDNWPLAPRDTIISIKRLMGRGVSDEEVQKVRSWAQYDIIEPEDGTADGVRVTMGGKAYSPVEISAMILRKLKQDAEFRLGEAVSHAVITVPAYFSQIQRDATRKAGAMAGLTVIRILDEPTAAAIAFGIESTERDATKYVLVYDLGGGTFDVSVLLWSGTVFAPLNLEGDMWLGGDNFDRAIMDEALKRVKSEHGIDPAGNIRFLAALRKESQAVKERLTASDSAEIVVPGLLRDDAGEVVDFSMDLSRQEFETLVRPLVRRSMEIVRTALNRAELAPAQIDHVLLAGNATTNPAIQREMETLFGRERISRQVHPKHSVAMGAAIVAARVGPIEVSDSGHSISGAAAGSLDQAERDAFVHGGIAPFDYGIQTAGDKMTVFIAKSDPYPTVNPITLTFYTQVQNQRMLCLPVYGGENRGQASANEKAGEAIGILPSGMPCGAPIRITLWLDSDGVFDLAAKLEDGTDLRPWIMKGEADARAVKAIELSDQVMAGKRGAGSLTPRQLADIDSAKNQALDMIRAGQFSNALSKANELLDMARTMGPTPRASRAAGCVRWARWVVKRYPWAFLPERLEFLRSLTETVAHAVEAGKEDEIREKVDLLDRETDNLPEPINDLNDALYRTENRLKPVDARTAALLLDELKHIEDAYMKKDPAAPSQLADARRRMEAALRVVPSTTYLCSCGAKLAGERFCPSCGTDGWLVQGPRAAAKTDGIPGSM